MVEWAMVGLIFTNGLWIFAIYNLRRMFGAKHFDSTFKAVTRRIKHPARFHKFYKSQYLESEVMDMTLPPKFYPNYTIPLTLDEGKRYNGESPLKEYVVLEGALENSDPMRKEQPFFNALFRLGETNNKARDIEEARIRTKYENDLVTKKHFNIGIIIVLIAIFGVLALLYNMNNIVDGFSQQYESYKPFIEQAVRDFQGSIPRIEPTTGGG